MASADGAATVADLTSDMERALSELESATRPLAARSLDARASNRNAPANGEDGESSVHDSLSPSAYTKRLSTFRASSYFAKPAALSPLVCARFGWTNTSRDMLVCSHSSCDAAVCVAYHPVLSARSVSRLTATYREMLATSHQRDCPFRADAERWLRDDRTRVRTTPRKVRDRELVVPPYLISMSDEFALLESAGCGGRMVTSRVIGKAALELTEQLNATECQSPLNVLILPTEVKDFVEKKCSRRFKGLVTVESVAKSIHSFIRTNLQPGQDSSDGAIIKPRALYGLSDEKDDAEQPGETVEQTCALLAAFGWRSTGEDDVLLSSHFIVQCGVCMAKGAIPAGECAANSTDERPAKKRRTQESGITTMDLIASHRSFCPYACGFCLAAKFEGDGTAAVNDGGQSVSGWKIILATLLGDDSNSSETGEETDKIFSSVRNMLRLAFSP